MVREGGGGGAYGIPSQSMQHLEFIQIQNKMISVQCEEKTSLYLFSGELYLIELIGRSELGLTIGPQVLIFSLCIGPNH